MDKSKFCIMTVDDFFSMRRIIMTQLRDMGFENVVEADSGVTALKMLETHKVDLIISDWNMPKMTGIELLRAVRANPAYKHLPFFMVTAESDKENVVEAVRAGVTNYILKPFTPDKFRAKFEQVLATIPPSA